MHNNKPTAEELCTGIAPKDRQWALGLIREHYEDFVKIGHPFEVTDDGTDRIIRFKRDPLIVTVYDHFMRQHGGMNTLWLLMERGEFSEFCMRRFYRNLGYSLCGYAEIWDHRGGILDPKEKTC